MKVYCVAVHSVTRGSPGGRDDGYPTIERLPTLYTSARVAQAEADLLNAEPISGARGNRPRVKGEYGWHFIEAVPVLNAGMVAAAKETKAAKERKRLKERADRLRAEADALDPA